MLVFAHFVDCLLRYCQKLELREVGQEINQIHPTAVRPFLHQGLMDVMTAQDALERTPAICQIAPTEHRFNHLENCSLWCSYRCSCLRYCLLTGLIVQDNLRDS